MNKIVGALVIVLYATFGFSQNNKYENLVFEGAGIKGIAYSGVLKELEQRNIIEEITRK